MKDKNISHISDLKIIGDLHIESDVFLDATVEGNIIAMEGNDVTLICGPSCHVNGDIRVPIIKLNGLVDGNLVITKEAYLGEKAEVNGDIHYGKLEMLVGATVVGHMTKVVDN